MRLALVVLAVLLSCLWRTAAAADAHRDQASPAAAYIEALSEADQFLRVWVYRDFTTGMGMMSSSLLAKNSRSPDDPENTLRSYMSGVSNPHHEAFEIGRGIQVAPTRFLFPVRLFELYTGESSGFVYSDTLGVIQEGDDWRIDRLPRIHDPD